MSYANCETALITTLKLLTTTFNTANVTAGDYRCIENGRPNSAVIRPGAMGDNGVGARVSNRTWDLLIDLFIRFTDDTSYHNFAVLRDTVIGHLDKYPTLNNTAGITVLTLTSDGDPQDVMDKRGGGPFDVVQRFRLTVADRTAVTGGEYA